MGERVWRGVSRLWPALCGVLLAGILWTGGIDASAPPGAEAYHERVRRAVERIPYRVGSWVGSDVEAQPAAVKLLKPNAMLQRRYVDTETGRSVSLLVVHCGDSRDMLGHYPPVCYPAHGWLEDGLRETTVEIEGMRYPARWYRFRRSASGAEQQFGVFGFFVLPDGRIVADMETVTAVSGRRAVAALGAAQVQVISDESLEPAERRRLINRFVKAVTPLIRTIAEGGQG